MSEQPVTQRHVYSARPTIRVDGEALERVSELLVAMSMSESVGGMSSLELRLSNVASLPEGAAELAFEDDEVLRLGAELAVYSGDVSGPREIFRGRISALEGVFSTDHPPELVVFAEDRLQGARMRRRTLYHDDLDLKRYVDGVAGALGLRAVVSGYDRSLGGWMQLNESDLAFLRRVLRHHDGDLQVVGEELHVSRRSEVDRGELQLAMYGQLKAVSVTADLAEQASEVTVSGWDVAQGSAFQVSSQGSALSPGQGRPGRELLIDGFGERAEHLGDASPAHRDEALAWADAAFDTHARRFVCARGVAVGNPELRVGVRVKLTGLGARFDNTYYVARVCHRFDARAGYETDFEAECAYLGGP